MDERFQRGLERFNQRDFYEAHEVLEDLWHEYRENDRTFLQGLIQISAGLYHLDCRNFKGARSQLEKGLKKLAVYHPFHSGVNVGTLTGDVHRCLAAMDRIEKSKEGSFDLSLFPSIHYSPEKHYRT
ncbi:MAG: DUF309 domain-containing protein [Ignavibacteriales bacterium]|nr:DUF309 domain-containing protein [Ignavibacteriales bacterium]